MLIDKEIAGVCRVVEMCAAMSRLMFEKMLMCGHVGEDWFKMGQ